jgi:hypothetical protein
MGDMGDISLSKKLKEIAPDISEAAQDITVGEFIAVTYGKLSPPPQFGELKFKDIKTIYNALGGAVAGGGKRLLEPPPDAGAPPCCCVELYNYLAK